MIKKLPFFDKKRIKNCWDDFSRKVAHRQVLVKKVSPEQPRKLNPES